MKFQVLGIVASTAYSLRRYGWAIAVAALTGLFVGHGIIADSRLNRGPARQVTVQEVAEHKVPDGSFVAIRGVFSTFGALEEVKKRSGVVMAVYTPLQDPSGDAQIFVSANVRMT